MRFKLTRKNKTSSKKNNEIKLQQIENEHRMPVDSFVTSTSDLDISSSEDDEFVLDDELVLDNDPVLDNEPVLQGKPIPVFDFQQSVLDLLEQPAPLNDAQDCERQLNRINYILLCSVKNKGMELPQEIIINLINQLNALNNQLRIFSRESSKRGVLSPDMVILKNTNKQLWLELDKSFFKLRRPFVSHIEIYFDNLLRLASGNFKPYSHKLEYAEYMAEAGHIAHSFAGFLEAGAELLETLGYHMPRYLHVLQSSLACVFSLALPIIPLISGVYTIVSNELLIKKARDLSHNVSKITSRERKHVFEAFFLRLSHFFKDQILNSKPNVILADNQRPAMEKNNPTGISSLGIWEQVLIYILPCLR